MVCVFTMNIIIMSSLIYVISCRYQDHLLSSSQNDGLDIYEIIQSENNKYHIILQDDNNVVGYEGTKAFFSTNTSCYDLGKKGINCFRHALFVLQNDGNLVVYTHNNYCVWSISTNGIGIGPYKLTMQNDRNIVLTDSRKEILWSSNTAI